MNLFRFLSVWFGVIAILSISPVSVSAAEKPESPVKPENIIYEKYISEGNFFVVLIPKGWGKKEKDFPYAYTKTKVCGVELSGPHNAAGCVPVEKVPGSGGEVIQIKQGNVGTFHELRIGVTNIIKADYLDEAGIKKHGLIAILTLFIEGNPPQEKDFKVHAGQKIIMDKYLVYVEEIRGTVKGLVILRIEEISKSPYKDDARLTISVLYYEYGQFFKSYEKYINLEIGIFTRLAPEKDVYIMNTAVAGRDAEKFEIETYELILLPFDRPDLEEGIQYAIVPPSKKVTVIKRYIVIPAEKGFYVLNYSASSDIVKSVEGIFEKVLNSFEPLTK
jgi:hypothetical protein